MKYALNLAEDGRVLSVTEAKYAPANAVTFDGEASENAEFVGTMKAGKVPEYRFENGVFIHDPLPEPEQPEVEPTTEEILNAMLGV